MSEPSLTARLRRAALAARTGRQTWIWALILAILVTAVALYWGPVAGLGPLARPHLPMWLLVVGFALGERCVVSLRFRRSSQMFSLGDVALVFGLIFAGGQATVLAGVLGSGLILLWHAGPPLKLCFNVAAMALHSCLAAIVVHALAPASPGVGPLTWLAVGVAMLGSGVVATLLIAGAMSLADGLVAPDRLARMIGTASLIESCNVGLALSGAAITAANPTALILLLLPCVVLYRAYHAHLSAQERLAQVEFLYQANRILTSSRAMGPALEELLERAVETFSAEQGEIVLFGSEDNPSLRTLVGAGQGSTIMGTIDQPLTDALRRLARRAAPAALMLEVPFAETELRTEFASRGVKRVILAALPGEQQPFGVIMLANRLVRPLHFSPAHLRLLEALAGNASVALQYERLEDVVSQLREIHGQLHHEARHDPLTALANRTLFTEKVTTALEAQTSDVGLLFVDLDNFKAVNDTYGHQAGDELLLSAASRLRSCVRADDLVGRLGGDEFAILIEDRADAHIVAVEIAERIVGTFRDPVTISGAAVMMQLSVGVASRRNRTVTAVQLIHEADLAMYDAKTHGKGRFHVFMPA